MKRIAPHLECLFACLIGVGWGAVASGAADKSKDSLDRRQGEQNNRQ